MIPDLLVWKGVFSTRTEINPLRAAAPKSLSRLLPRTEIILGPSARHGVARGLLPTRGDHPLGLNWIRPGILSSPHTRRSSELVLPLRSGLLVFSTRTEIIPWLVLAGRDERSLLSPHGDHPLPEGRNDAVLRSSPPPHGDHPGYTYLPGSLLKSSPHARRSSCLRSASWGPKKVFSPRTEIIHPARCDRSPKPGLLHQRGDNPPPQRALSCRTRRSSLHAWR